jgi:peptidoglycan/LPS O-acetylase OafA/YrhL
MTRLVSVDALRGFAAVWVFAYHLWNVFAPGYSPQGSPKDHVPLAADTPAGVVATYPVFAYGYTGVGLFFVLSGFCIHLPHARRFHKGGDDRLEPRPFFRRRFWRLYPAFAASLLLGAAGVAVMGAPADRIAQHVLINAFFLLALRPDALMLGPVYWTLWYEVQFYLLYPFLLKACRRVGFGPVAGVLLACELGFALLPVPEFLKPVEKHFEWLFLRRYFEWFLGVWLAERLASGRAVPKRAAAGVIVGGATLGVACSHVPALWAVHELFLAVASFGLLALLTAPGPEPAAGSLRGRVRGLFAGVGDWSYSLYLIHMPLMRLINAAVVQLPDSVRDEWAYAIFGAASAALVPLTAYVWYRLFEKPFLPDPQALTPRPPLPPAPSGGGGGAGEEATASPGRGRGWAAQPTG